MLDKHLNTENQEKSELLYATYINNTVPADVNIINLLKEMLNLTEFSKFKQEIEEMHNKFVTKFKPIYKGLNY